MQVFKIEPSVLALELLAVADGNNFDELDKEVKEIGGSAELISDELARVEVKGRSYELPIGYVLVFDGGYTHAKGREHIGYARLINKAQFDNEYVSAKEREFDLDDLAARVAKIETEIGKLTKPKSSRTGKSSGTE